MPTHSLPLFVFTQLWVSSFKTVYSWPHSFAVLRCKAGRVQHLSRSCAVPVERNSRRVNVTKQKRTFQREWQRTSSTGSKPRTWKTLAKLLWRALITMARCKGDWSTTTCKIFLRAWVNVYEICVPMYMGTCLESARSHNVYIYSSNYKLKYRLNSFVSVFVFFRFSRWYKEDNGRRLSVVDSDRVHSSNGVLSIRAVGVQDGGRYVCLARNSLGEQKMETLLSVAGKCPIISPIRPCCLRSLFSFFRGLEGCFMICIPSHENLLYGGSVF